MWGPAALGISVDGLARHRDRDAVQRCTRGHRPVRTEAQRRTRGVQRSDRVLLVGPLRTQPRDGQHRHQRVQLGPQRLHVGDDTELGEPRQVGVVDQLAVRDHRPAIAWTVLRDNVFDRIECLPHRGVADGVDVDLQAEFVDAAGRLGQRLALPVAHAQVLPRVASLSPEWLCRPEQYGASNAPVSFSTTPSAKNFTDCAVSSGEASLVDFAPLRGVLRHLGVEVSRVGVQREVEPHPQHPAARSLDVGVDVGGLDPGVLHPRHATRQEVVGGRAERVDADLLSPAAVPRSSPDRLRPIPATCPAPTRRRGAESRRDGGSGVSAVIPARSSAAVLHHTVW